MVLGRGGGSVYDFGVDISLSVSLSGRMDEKVMGGQGKK